MKDRINYTDEFLKMECLAYVTDMVDGFNLEWKLMLSQMHSLQKFTMIRKGEKMRKFRACPKLRELDLVFHKEFSESFKGHRSAFGSAFSDFFAKIFLFLPAMGSFSHTTL